MNRRNFLRGFAGLAALAVAGPSLAALTQTDRERLVAQMRDGGVIEGQTFVIHDGRGITFNNIRNLSIRRCNFIWTTPCTGALLQFGRNTENCEISNCNFDGGWRRPWMSSPLAPFDVEVSHP